MYDGMGAGMKSVRREITQLEKHIKTLRTMQGCDWKEIGRFEYDKRVRIYRCSRCKSETYNLPYFRDAVCSVRL